LNHTPPDLTIPLQGQPGRVAAPAGLGQGGRWCPLRSATCGSSTPP